MNLFFRQPSFRRCKWLWRLGVELCKYPVKFVVIVRLCLRLLYEYLRLFRLRLFNIRLRLFNGLQLFKYGLTEVLYWCGLGVIWLRFGFHKCIQTYVECEQLDEVDSKPAPPSSGDSKKGDPNL